MILDANLLFDGSQNTAGTLTGSAITTASGSSQVSANVLDLLNARDIGNSLDGLPPRLLVLVTAAFLSTGAGTLQVSFQGSTDNTNWTTYVQTPAIASGTLIVGAELMNISVPGVLPQTGALPRYLRLSYAVATQIFTAGSILAGIVLGRDDPRAYPPGVTVSN